MWNAVMGRIGRDGCLVAVSFLGGEKFLLYSFKGRGLFYLTPSNMLAWSPLTVHSERGVWYFMSMITG